MNPLWLMRLVQLHFRVTPLGLPRIVGDEETVAVTASFDERTLAKLREMRKARPLAEAVDRSAPEAQARLNWTQT
jgi:acyl-homoserine lactone synthase